MLIEQNIPYKKELHAQLEFHGATIGRYFLDFLLAEKIVLELKAKPLLEQDDIRQVYAYLKANRLKLGILANFRPKRLIYRRIVNPDRTITLNEDSL